MKPMDGNTDMIERLNYGSHLPALMACAAVCDGPILEIGSGNFSTPCLHALCSAMGTPLVTTELDDNWRAEFMEFDTPGHKVMKQTDALLAELAALRWGVVLVDDAPDTRIDRLNMFYGSARYVLHHDSNFPQYDQVLKEWVAAHKCHHRIYAPRYGPHTLVVSKTHPIPEF